MKNIGKIVNYNGSSGFIINDNGKKYILSKNNILYPNPKNGDIVTFKVESFKTIEINETIAIFVQKLHVDNNYNN